MKIKVKKYGKGFSLLEILIYIAIFTVIILAVTSLLFWMNKSSAQEKAGREAVENARTALDFMVHEIKNAKSIYTSTTTQTQLSLETTDYLPIDESITYIDFFKCGDFACFKRESQNAVFLTSDNVKVTNLLFTPFETNNKPSVQITLTVKYPGNNYTTSLTSTASLRSY